VAGVMICSVGAEEVAGADGEGGTVPMKLSWVVLNCRRGIPGSIPKPEIATSASSGTSNQASSNPLGEVYYQLLPHYENLSRLTSWQRILRLLDSSESSSRPATTQEAYIPLAIHPSPTSRHDFSSHS
jgi:hypothetical protein